MLSEIRMIKLSVKKIAVNIGITINIKIVV